MRSRAEAIAFTAILAALTTVFFAAAWRLESGTRMGPIGVTSIVLALLLFQLGRDLRPAASSESKRQPDEKIVLAWVLALLAAIWLVGCMAAIGLHALLYVRYRGKRSWAMAIAWGCLAALPVYAVSVWMLRPELRTGALLSWQ